MQKSELLQRFGAFFQHPNIQEKGELELAYFLDWFFATQIRDEHDNDSIIPMLPRYITVAMRCLREESVDLQVCMFRQLHLAARGQQEVPDLAGMSPINANQEATITLVSQLMGKITGNNLAEQLIAAYLRSPIARNTRIRELQNTLVSLLAKEQKALSLQKEETNARKRLHEAFRDYLLAEVKATRAGMLVVDTRGKFVAGRREGEHVPHIYFPQLFSQEELSSLQLQAQNYNRDAIVIFQEEDGKRKPTSPADYDDIRKYWNVSTGQCFFFTTWEEAVSYYFHLFSVCWFRINPQTFFDKRSWQKTV